MENIMEFGEEMKQRIAEAFSEDMRKDISLNDADVTKINDQKLKGISFKRSNSEAAPTIYLNKYFDQYMRGRSVEDIRNEIVEVYMNTLSEKTPEMSPKRMDFDTVKDHLTFRVVEINRNRDYLSEKPYALLGNGLAAVCDIKMYEELDGIWQTTVTNDLAEKQGYDKAELFCYAMGNAEKVDPPKLTSMGANIMMQDNTENLLDTLGELDDVSKELMYVISNESGMYGAAALFYPGMQERIADKLGESYYAIPSSLHEYIIVPESAGIEAKQLVDMLKQANETVVAPGDVLSDNLLHYDRDTKSLDSVTELLSKDSKEQEMVC